ncbi:pyocin knob domain-containing protein [Corynebacterium minutissimum]|uniref:pyocin knob domain-containing protein n=1 Tax=Corynebacterium minutissimum TaxID=38301 RepID=UPI001EF17D47|nr:pyocin knob domain-containing protein [Corynebacterium minutissimum]MCG7239562.1 pyocin knob domain-containing protein [Corynebacterium minutissimum]
MPKISGYLEHVTGDPDLVTSVGVSAVKVRPNGSGLITTSPKQYTVTGGKVSFPCEPGLAQLTIHYLNSAVESVPLLVPEGASATLGVCYAAALEAANNPDDSVLSEILQAVIDTAASEISKIVSLKDTAIADVMARVNKELAEAISRFEKQGATEIQPGVDWNKIVAPGTYIRTESRDDPNAPTTGAGTLKVEAVGDGQINQRWWESKGGVWLRSRGTKSWDVWTRQDTPYPRPIVTGEDVRDLPVGKYSVLSQKVAESMPFKPEDTQAWGPALITVKMGVGGYSVITWEGAQPASSDLSGVWQTQQDTSGNWAPWRKTDGVIEEEESSPLSAINIGDDVFALLPGIYTVNSHKISVTVKNRPDDPAALGTSLVTVRIGGGGYKIVTWESQQPATSGLSGVWQTQQDTAGNWAEWRKTDGVEEEKGMVAVQLNDDVFTLPLGEYTVNTYAIAASVKNRPDDPAATGVSRVTVRMGGGAHKIITWESQQPANSNLSGIWQTQEDNAGNWAPWRRVDNPPAWDNINDRISSVASSMYALRKGTIATMQQLSPAEKAPVWAWAAPEGMKLTTPTHDGSGQATHPSVLYFKDGWNGYKYWMAMTPYPGGDEGHEDPNILASQNGTTWVVPEGLTNPIDDQKGKPNPHNSDTNIVMGPDGAMWLTWRMVDRPNGDLTRIFAARSTNGVEWGTPVEIWTAKPGTDEAGLLSQSLVWTGSTWRLYGVRNATRTNRLSFYETSDKNPTKDSAWKLQDCAIDAAGPGRNFWHVDVQYYNGAYLGIIQDMASQGRDGDIYFMRSADGVTWERSTVPLVDKIGSAQTAIYKTGFVPLGSGDNLTLDVYYPGWTVTPTQSWAIFRTTARAMAQGRNKLGKQEFDLTKKVEAGFTVGSIKLVTVGNLATLSISDLIRTDAPDNNKLLSAGAIPAELTPPMDIYATSGFANSQENTARFRMFPTGQINGYSLDQGWKHSATIMWPITT